jgi:hypothetical protein
VTTQSIIICIGKAPKVRWMYSKTCYGIGGTVADPQRPKKIDLTAQECKTELALLRDLKDAHKYGSIYPKRLKEAQDNLAELYSLVVARYRNER